MRHVLLPLLCLLSLNSNSQIWVENNATWHYDFVDSSGHFGYYEVTHFDDTTFLGQPVKLFESVKHLFYNFGTTPADIAYLGQFSSGGLGTFSDSSKVYLPDEIAGVWRTFLDFDAQVNDSWWYDVTNTGFPVCNDSSGVIVTGTGISNIFGVDYRYIDLEPLPGSLKVLKGRFYERFAGDYFIPIITENCDGIPAISDSIYNLRCFQDDSLMMNFVSEDCLYQLTHLGIEESSASLEVFPNPTNGSIRFSGTRIFEVEILTLEGKKVLTTKVSVDQIIKLNELPPGSYLLRCTTENDAVIKRIILQ